MKWEIDERRVPSRAEVKHLLKIARERSEGAISGGRRQSVIDYAVLVTLVGSGLRSHELADLQIRDLRIGHGEGSITVRHGKGDKHRVVAIPDSLKQQLKKFLHWKQAKDESFEADAPLFQSERGGGFCTRAVRHLFKRCLLHAGLDRQYGVHSMRHFHLSALYEKTNDLRLVQDQAGHSSITVTQVYTHVSLDKRRAAVDRLF